MRNTIIILLALLFVLGGCEYKNSTNIPTNLEANGSDTVELILDQVDSSTIELLPQEADGVFADFIYDFTNEKSFQKQRIKFPLSIKLDKNRKEITRDKWVHQRLYADSTYYFSVYASEQFIDLENDTFLKKAYMEWVALEKQFVYSLNFSKKEGIWMLDSITSTPFDCHENGDFFEFYRLFSTNEHYQIDHISQHFLFKTLDNETSSEIEGYIERNQWPVYAPFLPHGTLVFINHNQPFAESSQRILMIANPNENIEMWLYFRKNGKNGWELYSIEI